MVEGLFSESFGYRDPSCDADPDLNLGFMLESGLLGRNGRGMQCSTFGHKN